MRKILATLLWAGVFLSAPWPVVIAQVPQQQDNTIAASKLTLTMEQRYTIKEIIKGYTLKNERSDAQIEVGKVVPKSIELRRMPVEIVAKVSSIKSHMFFIQGAKVVIVDPKDNRVVEVID